VEVIGTVVVVVVAGVVVDVTTLVVAGASTRLVEAIATVGRSETWLRTEPTAVLATITLTVVAISQAPTRRMCRFMKPSWREKWVWGLSDR
jgi:hypothetical protein